MFSKVNFFHYSATGPEKTHQKNTVRRSKDFLKRSDTVSSILFKSLAPNPGFVSISLSRFS
jgi:hypothetical protein